MQLFRWSYHLFKVVAGMSLQLLFAGGSSLITALAPYPPVDTSTGHCKPFHCFELDYLKGQGLAHLTDWGLNADKS